MYNNDVCQNESLQRNVLTGNSKRKGKPVHLNTWILVVQIHI